MKKIFEDFRGENTSFIQQIAEMLEDEYIAEEVPGDMIPEIPISKCITLKTSGEIPVEIRIGYPRKEIIDNSMIIVMTVPVSVVNAELMNKIIIDRRIVAEDYKLRINQIMPHALSVSLFEKNRNDEIKTECVVLCDISMDSNSEEKIVSVIQKLIICMKRYYKEIQGHEEEYKGRSGDAVTAYSLIEMAETLHTNLNDSFETFFRRDIISLMPPYEIHFRFRRRFMVKQLPILPFDIVADVKQEYKNVGVIDHPVYMVTAVCSVQNLNRLKTGKAEFLNTVNKCMEKYELSFSYDPDDDDLDSFNLLELNFQIGEIPHDNEEESDEYCNAEEVDILKSCYLAFCDACGIYAEMMKQAALKRKEKKPVMQVVQHTVKHSDSIKKAEESTEEETDDNNIEIAEEIVESDAEEDLPMSEDILLEMYNELEDSIAEKDMEISRIMAENERLKAQIKKLTATTDGNAVFSASIVHTEHELYEGEVKDQILKALIKEYGNISGDPRMQNTRKVNVLHDIIENNSQTGFPEKIISDFRNILNENKSGLITDSQISALKNLGFKIEHGGHYKLYFAGDTRYPLILGSTTSDYRFVNNMITDMKRNVF